METEINTNKAIVAKFMGAKLADFDCYDFLGIEPDGQFFQFWNISKIKYDESWDWLMPVIKKIKSLDWKDDGILGVLYVDIFNYLDDIDIKYTFITVVKFLKQYKNEL